MCSCDTPEFSSREMRRTRKPRRCDECRKTIQPGERYQHEAIVFDGAFSTIDTCEACARLYDEIFHAVEDCCELPALGDMAAWLREPANASVVAAIEAKRSAAA